MKLLVVDGNSILNRAYYGVRILSSSKGVYTNAIFGFFNIFWKALEEEKPDAVAVAFDLRGPTFRHKAVSSYKANRKGMPEELAMQLPYVKSLLSALGIAQVTCEGYEADDILGTLSLACEQAEADCVLMTGDRDSLQLIAPHTVVRLVTSKGHVHYDTTQFTEEYGFSPIHLIDLKALMGDSSDHISGVPGVGEKTALTLVREWNTIEALYAHLEEAQLTAGLRKKLDAGREAAKESKWLATIVRDVPVSVTLSDYIPAPAQEETLRQILTELELFKLLERLSLQPLTETPAAAEAQKEAVPVFASELTRERFAKFCTEGGYFLLTGHDLQVWDGAESCLFRISDEQDILQFLESEAPKYTFDAKPVYRWALERGGQLRGLQEDVRISAYLLNPTASDYSIERLCECWGIGFTEAIAVLPRLCTVLHAAVEEQGMLSLLREIELPLTEVLAHMEHIGVGVDGQAVREFGEQLSEEIETLEQTIYTEAGHPFLISSPKQLGVVLFEEQKLPAGKKTKSGYSTNAEVLEKLREESPLVDAVLRWRQLTKLRSTYVDGLLKTIGADGRIHSSFQQTETRTGRISSTEPNLQNIPVRTELGRQMRRYFVAKPGHVLVDADYSQIELRVLAHLCGDETMQETFRSGGDIHASTAAQVFGMPPELVTAEMRSAAKAVNFGIIYGIGAFSLSKDLNISMYNANRYIQNYFAQFPKVESFMQETVAHAKETGFVRTMYGRRRPIPELASPKKQEQAMGSRIAMNTPVQGAAADLIKIAMVQVFRRLQTECPQAKLILQVHDELILEVPAEYGAQAAEILQTEMQQAASLSVPLTADVHIGENWYEAKG